MPEVLDCLVCFCNNQSDEWQWQQNALKQSLSKEKLRQREFKSKACLRMRPETKLLLVNIWIKIEKPLHLLPNIFFHVFFRLLHLCSHDSPLFKDVWWSCFRSQPETHLAPYFKFLLSMGALALMYHLCCCCWPKNLHLHIFSSTTNVIKDLCLTFWQMFLRNKSNWWFSLLSFSKSCKVDWTALIFFT